MYVVGHGLVLNGTSAHRSKLKMGNENRNQNLDERKLSCNKPKARYDLFHPFPFYGLWAGGNIKGSQPISID